MIDQFKLDTKLAADSLRVTKLRLSEVRLIDNSDYSWLILVPQLNNISEITDLILSDYNDLCGEVHQISQVMQKLYQPDKLNIASLGNVVKQLHVHIVARFNDDKLFPKPVWGHEFTRYNKEEAEIKIANIIDAIRNH